MAMKLVKKTSEYSIFKRGDERYAVKGANRQPINGEEKARILLAEDLIKVTLPAEKPAEEPEAAESSDEASAEAEASAEESPAEAAATEEAAGEAEADEEAK
ncbi:MAG: hypothetical protein NXI15_07715 [Gammaproteobacteria bacterium]|nr:hypothetical protein [Gammaproteobacteria bacterium]